MWVTNDTPRKHSRVYFVFFPQLASSNARWIWKVVFGLKFQPSKTHQRVRNQPKNEWKSPRGHTKRQWAWSTSWGRKVFRKSWTGWYTTTYNTRVRHMYMYMHIHIMYVASASERERWRNAFCASVVHVSKHGSWLCTPWYPFTHSTSAIITSVRFFGGGLDLGDKRHRTQAIFSQGSLSYGADLRFYNIDVILSHRTRVFGSRVKRAKQARAYSLPLRA